MKTLLLALSLCFTFGLSFSAATAQSNASATPQTHEIESDAEVEGIISMYDRTFSADLTVSLASPDADISGADTSASLRMVSIQAITFDTNAHALAYLDMMRDGPDSEPTRDESLGAFAVTELDIVRVDGFKMTTDMGDFDFGATIIIFIDGNHAFLIMVTDTDQPTSEALADDVTDFILNAEVENEEITFNENGTSTGGVFDRMPAAGEEMLGELTQTVDTELFIANE